MNAQLLFCTLFFVLTAAFGLCAQAQDKRPEYQLGAGDTIRIFVYQNPDLTLETRVNENGTITFPLIGNIKIGGMTVPSAEKAIANALRDGGFIKKPQVSIVVLQVRSNQVSVLGQVNRPGRFPLETLNIRVSEMIAIAGGISAGGANIAGGNSTGGADIAILTGVRDGKPFRKDIDIADMFLNNKLQDDLVVEGGDIIYVPRQPVFYIYGEVQHPGSYPVERGMTIRQALAQGGGPTLRGTESGLRLYRRGVIAPKLQLDDPVQGYDVLYVRERTF